MCIYISGIINFPLPKLSSLTDPHMHPKEYIANLINLTKIQSQSETPDNANDTKLNDHNHSHNNSHHTNHLDKIHSPPAKKLKKNYKTKNNTPSPPAWFVIILISLTIIPIISRTLLDDFFKSSF